MKPALLTKSARQVAFILLVIAFTGASTAQQTESNTAMPIVSGAWIKTTVPGGNVSAAYMQIKSPTPLKLIKAESPVAGIVEIHNMKMNNGVMEMKALDALDVPPDRLVELRPGGVHVMLMNVKKPINRGDRVPLTLTFEGVGKRPMVVKLEVVAQENNSGANKH